MSDVLPDLHKARISAIHDRREHARRLAGLAGPDRAQTIDDLIKSQKALDAIEAAIAYEDRLERYSEDR